MFTSRPFRFGIAGEHAKTRNEWIAKARLAETLGYHIFLVPDHFWIDVAPIAALMAAADATTSIRIGSHIFANDFRNPAMLAREVATLDMLSEGRFQLGLGVAIFRLIISRRALRLMRLECGLTGCRRLSSSSSSISLKRPSISPVDIIV